MGLHVDRATAPEVAVCYIATERRMGPVPHRFLRHRHHVLVADECNGVEARVRPLPGVEESGFADDFLLQGLMHQRVRLFEDLVEFVELRPVRLRLIEVGHGRTLNGLLHSGDVPLHVDTFVHTTHFLF